MPEQGNDNGQADGRFGRGDRDHEKRQNLAVHRPEVRLTALSMISTDSRIVIRLRRRNTPAVPMENRTADSAR
jgi:hypothetical protein